MTQGRQVGRIAGVIPCAGVSRRMGEDKALIDAGGTSFLARGIRTLRPHCDPVLVVVRPERTDLANVARGEGATVLTNPDPSPGPIASIRIALAFAREGRDCDGMVLLPVDHPAVRTETVAAVCAAYRSAAPETPIVVPVLDGATGHPPLFGSAVFAELLAPELEGGARTVLHADPDRVLRLEVDDPGVTLDLDTPEDWRSAIQSGLLPPPSGFARPEAPKRATASHSSSVHRS